MSSNETKDNVEKTTADKPYTDPVTGKFKPGNPGGGRPPGSKNFFTDFDEVIDEIAKSNNITQSEARKILLKKAYIEAKDGNFNFYKDIADRYYGKVKESVEVEGGLRILFAKEFDSTDDEDVETPQVPSGDH